MTRKPRTSSPAQPVEIADNSGGYLTEREREQRRRERQKPDWMSEADWEDQLDEVRAWQRHRWRQRGGPEPMKH